MGGQLRYKNNAVFKLGVCVYVWLGGGVANAAEIYRVEEREVRLWLEEWAIRDFEPLLTAYSALFQGEVGPKIREYVKAQLEQPVNSKSESSSVLTPEAKEVERGSTLRTKAQMKYFQGVLKIGQEVRRGEGSDLELGTSTSSLSRVVLVVKLLSWVIKTYRYMKWVTEGNVRENEEKWGKKTTCGVALENMLNYEQSTSSRCAYSGDLLQSPTSKDVWEATCVVGWVRGLPVLSSEDPNESTYMRVLKTLCLKDTLDVLDTYCVKVITAALEAYARTTKGWKTTFPAGTLVIGDRSVGAVEAVEELEGDDSFPPLRFVVGERPVFKATFAEKTYSKESMGRKHLFKFVADTGECLEWETSGTLRVGGRGSTKNLVYAEVGQTLLLKARVVELAMRGGDETVVLNSVVVFQVISESFDPEDLDSL